MSNPIINIIIPVYNGAQFIAETIASVQEQTFKEINVLIVDDGSTDNTIDVVTELIKNSNNIRLIEKEHSGLSATLNTGIANATQSLIALIDADDLWHPQKLEKQVEKLMESDAGVCFCLIQEFETFEDKSIRKSHAARTNPMKGYAKSTFLGHKNLFEKHGLFNPAILTGDFVEWMSRVIRSEERVVLIEEVLAYRRVHQNNMSGGLNKNDYLDILKMHLDKKRKSQSA